MTQTKQTSDEAVELIPGIVEGVREHFRSGRTREIGWRIEQLRQIIRMMEEKEALFLTALEKDLGKPAFEAWAGEIGSVAEEARYALKHLAAWTRPERVSTPIANQLGSSRLHWQPLGVVLVIAPFNYPVQLLLSPLIPIIAAGNCAVLKPSDLTPHATAALAESIPQYLDRECIRVVQGGVPQTRALLAERFDHIFFTGSERVGRIVLEAAARHLTPTTLELGGKSPVIVDVDANLGTSAKRITWGKFFNTGQTCVAPDYVLVVEAHEEALVAGIRDCIRTFYGEDPRQSPDLGRIVNERHFQRLVGLLEGTTPYVGGTHDLETCYIAPTVLRGVKAGDRIMEEEIFGPILPILTVPDVDAAIAFVAERPDPLALYLFSENREVQQRVIERTRSGGMCINETMTHLRVPELPFGGLGSSGMGVYHGKAGFETFSHPRGVFRKSTVIDPSLRYPPYNEGKLKMAKRLM